MIRLKMYGQPSSTYEYIKMMIKENAYQSRVDIDITEVHDVKTFIEKKVNKIPAVQINDEDIVEYSNKDDINQFIDDLTQRVLDECDYENLPKIIVPVDFSSTSANALRYAIQYAQVVRASINVIHCYSTPLASVAGPVQVTLDLTDSKKKHLKSFKDKITAEFHSSLPVIKEELIVGDTVSTILELAKDYPKATIIMGSQGNNATIKRLFGSVSIAIAQNASCPVFIIPPDAKFRRPDFVAYAYQQLDNHNKELDLIGSYAMMMDSYVYMVHVDSTVSDIDSNKLTAYMEKEFPKLNTFNIQVVDNNIAHGIRDFIESNDIEVLIASRLKSNLLKRMLHKSVTKKLMIDTSTPLLVLHHN